ncbi:M67 family metallopeptidase [Gemmata sp. JC717]|uniref:M67 family metallopeptidase n=1 Tax=Gemmata algarum TaxID=2975278 RepID=UPI0021BB5A71|nr:M67 family metallopeptidase [Gemmata algarum]MDY3556747.1 M67 family metallopeptidase [Gemmata algarum]
MPPFTALVLPDALRAEVVAHARAEFPFECCGLLAGTIDAGAGVATARFPVRNALRSPTDYLTDARGMFDAFRAMRAGGLELLAIYHSHPASAPVPSARDLACNTYGETVVHLIAGLAAAEPEVRGWWLGESEYREAVVTDAL